MGTTPGCIGEFPIPGDGRADLVRQGIPPLLPEIGDIKPASWLGRSRSRRNGPLAAYRSLQHGLPQAHAGPHVDVLIPGRTVHIEPSPIPDRLGTQRGPVLLPLPRGLEGAGVRLRVRVPIPVPVPVPAPVPAPAPVPTTVPPSVTPAPTGPKPVEIISAGGKSWCGDRRWLPRLPRCTTDSIAFPAALGRHFPLTWLLLDSGLLMGDTFANVQVSSSARSAPSGRGELADRLRAYFAALGYGEASGGSGDRELVIADNAAGSWISIHDSAIESGDDRTLDEIRPWFRLAGWDRRSV